MFWNFFEIILPSLSRKIGGHPSLVGLLTGPKGTENSTIALCSGEVRELGAAVFGSGPPGK